MPSALDFFEELDKTYKYASGARDLLESATKIRKIAKSTPEDLDEAKKVLGMVENEYIPLSKFLVGAQETVNATVAAGFPEIRNPAVDSRKRMEKIAKSAGPNSPGFERELTAYIKSLTKYELSLRERIAFMQIVQKKCDLNIKNFTLITKIIDGTVRALKALVVAVPSARNEAGNQLMKILSTGIEKQGPRVYIAHKKLKAAAAAHEKVIKKEQVYAKVRLKSANDKKLKFLMEDAKEFFKKLF